MNIKQDYLDQLIKRFNTGDEVDRHNAMMAALLETFSDAGQPQRGLSYQTYTYSLPNTSYRQILPYNAKRVALIISTSAATPDTTLVLLEAGPSTTQTMTDQTVLARAMPLPMYSNAVTGAQTCFIDYRVAPTNPITMLSLLATSGVIIEGIMP